ncbi:suppressor of tumorigenicity 14 protein homolog, partial [Centroberyx affinis]|uniref:suppressor of tumorigenicity 14 protein homolog n=1 Tax=Centroberyx affinis TaxID=166261 RepID=UPI003A5C0D63
MDLLDSGMKFSPKQDTADWDTALQFLPASDSKQVEKKPGRRKKVWIGLGLVAGAAGLALLTGLLVWNFHLRTDVRVKKVYIGSMGIADQGFVAAYEDPNSQQFKNLALLVSQQLKLIYAKNSELSKYFTGSTVDAFSEGDGGGDSVVAYYQSEFDVPQLRESSVDEAIASLEPGPEQQGRQGRLLLRPTGALSVNSVTSGALDPRMTKTAFF